MPWLNSSPSEKSEDFAVLWPVRRVRGSIPPASKDGAGLRAAGAAPSAGCVRELLLLPLAGPRSHQCFQSRHIEIPKTQKAAQTEQLRCWPGSQQRGEPSSNTPVPRPGLSQVLRHITGSTSWGEGGQRPALGLKQTFALGP